MSELSILKLCNEDENKENFTSNIRSTAGVSTKYEQVIVDYEWLDLMEDTIRYLDNILRNPNRFIVNEEEIVKIELARRVTVESIRHLSKHTNFIQKIEDNGDVKPSKILNINKDESYDTYENRLIYTLIENMKNFVEIKKINVKMIGLDLKEDVINKCNEIAKKYKFDNLHFELGDINGFKYNNKVDMVITLHACDTATDYALYNAIKWNAKMIFSVPCCQHEFNHQMKAENLDILTKYGIIQERVAALMTDSVRGNLLECAGYKTQLLEFIDISHSPKNILIRASKSNLSKDKKEKSLKQVEDLKKEFNFNPTLYNLLKDDNLI